MRIALVPVLVVVAGLGVVFWLLQVDGGRATPTSSSSSVSSAGAATREGVNAARALRRLTTDPESLVPDDQESAVDLDRAVPAGSTVDVETKSWAAASSSSGTLVARLTSPGRPAATYLVSMMKEGRRWVVVGTIPVD